MHKLFVFDVDGTLLPAVDSKISKATIEAVNSLLKQGHAVCIASGRPYSGIYPFYHSLMMDLNLPASLTEANSVALKAKLYGAAI